MSLKKKLLYAILFTGSLPVFALSPSADPSLADQLGWTVNPDNFCGGYYLEEPFVYQSDPGKQNLVETTGNQGMFSFHGTSMIEGKVTINRAGQQITSNKALLYRDPATGKLNAIDLIGHVNLREPNTLIVSKTGRYNFDTKSKSLIDVYYRTALSGKQEIAGSKVVSQTEAAHERKIEQMTAWGQADTFSQTEPRVYELSAASFTTCPPTNPIWHAKGSHIVLDKNSGRGSITNARIYLKNIPVFYMPYINFSIDGKRKTGFLWPTYGIKNNFGPYLLAPFYWNMAPNYDMTITPGVLTKRGIQLTDNMRYLTESSKNVLTLSVLPNDKDFQLLQKSYRDTYSSSTNAVTQAELNDLLTSSSTRKSAKWRNSTIFSESWSADANVNYVSDDYYEQDFGNELSDLTQNQLLQQGDVYYKSQNWNFTGRMQMYQTLHPLIKNQAATQNQYRRFPQLILSADYPDQKFGLEYFIDNELTHFTIGATPGAEVSAPIGNRMHTQPGVSLPIFWPYFYIDPRAQLALTDYQLYQTTQTQTPNSLKRGIPIFDMAMGLMFNRDMSIFGSHFQQTLEPQAYYTYIPYHDQSDIPIFDTTANTLTYDQLFNYNRFTGIDRIGDANQVGFGVTTRIIDQESGLEKARFGMGSIVYFKDREVTLCYNTSTNTCNPNSIPASDHFRISPVSGLLNYNVNTSWGSNNTFIWNPITKQLANATLGINFHPEAQHVINFGYSFARADGPYSGVVSNDSSNNLKGTDISAAWPLIHNVSAIGQWSQNWNQRRLQNLLYGVEYNSCCWAIRLVGGRAFAGQKANNPTAYEYNSGFYVQVALKGLGNVGQDQTTLLSSISGYNSQLG